MTQVAAEAAKNVAASVPALLKWRLGRARAGEVFHGEDAQLKRYAFQSLDVLRASGVSLTGKTVVEIGPGDFLTSGMALLAAGATRYVSMDRFVGDYGRLEGKSWYAGVQAAWPRHYPDLPWPQWLDAARFPEAYVPERVQALDTAVEDAPRLGQFDVVCSFQVAEHVSDLGAFAEANRALLRPGGTAVHRVDFGPHGTWRSASDPLTFLRFSDRLWSTTGSARGTPNRYRVHELVTVLETAGLSVKLGDLERYDKGEVAWSRLGARYRAMPEQSVLTRTAVVVVRR